MTSFTMERLAALDDGEIMKMNDDVEIVDFPRSLYETSHLRHLKENPELIFDLSEQAFGLDDFDLYSSVRINEIPLVEGPVALDMDELAGLSDEDIMGTKALLEVADLPRDEYEPAYDAWRTQSDPDVVEALEIGPDTSDFELYSMVRINGIPLAPAPAPSMAFG